MRGVFNLVARSISNPGIIPAHAGSIVGDLNNIIAIRDHPRSCGEYANRYDYNQTITGSSPLMRGVYRSLPLTTADMGIIPAHAGSIKD